MIKQADENDIPTIEGILIDVVIWMKKNKLQNQWNEDNIKWNFLSKDYQINDFYIDYQNGVPAGCIAITDLDQKYWPKIPHGKSLYIHKLAVKREFAGKGISKELINFAKNLSLKNGINSLRLDCNLQRNKLRRLYENEDFIYAGRNISENNYDMALYVWHV
ncbi:GNAT family N-acetyltransferase [Clostridium oryzae]|uniref:Acetyltransferase (GNAT) family protein n=1 Tax=Clostridium oryzae TaxID=1450648 RepID=A0A1V4ID69_9CLOT|nr:GNAT family N-acetyltransferase [Clostridium oryzae]OPJ57911.1 acetyltransferase (GNAT) family protein [Clostridium oryzae]